MKDENFDPVDWQLIRKQLDGKLSYEETARLERWMNEDESHRLFAEKAVRYYENDVPLVDGESVDTAWGRFMQDHRKPARNVRRRWMWGAAASVAIWLGVWALWPGSGEAPAIVAENDIRPGHACAVLLLSDGQEIDLNIQSDNSILTDNLANIRLDGKSIIYESRDVQSDSVYNTIRVPRGGEYNLTLGDGTKVWLNSQSSLRYPVAFRGKERRVQLIGEAYFDVVPGQERFIVETSGMDVRVLGTSFNVSAYEDETTIRTTLVQGKVEIVSGGAVVRTLSPGEQSVWERSTGNVEISEVNTSLYTQWKEGRFVFRDNALEDIMRTLARWYDMEYEFAQPELKNLRFYGTINRFDNVRDLLAQFEKTGNVKFEYHRDNVVLIK